MALPIEMTLSRAPLLSCTEDLRRVITDYNSSDEQVSSRLSVVFFSSPHLGQMRSRGFYATVRGLVVHGFSVATDPRGVRWYICAAAILRRAGRHYVAPS